MTAATRNDSHRWWASLKHGGLLIAPSKLQQYLPDRLDPLPSYAADRLRRDLTRMQGGYDVGTKFSHDDAVHDLMDTALERVAGLGTPGRSATGSWVKGNDVPPEYSRRMITGEAMRPRRLWQSTGGDVLPVFVTRDERLGIHRGRRTVARVVEWLRKGDQRLALLTNGHQWRLLHAGLDYEAFAEWDTALWLEEGEPSLQVEALRALLSPDMLTAAERGKPNKLLEAIEASRRGQAELSSELGERVRQAVEALIQAHGTALSQESNLEPRAIYLAATRVVMRLVVTLFAESRDLLPRDNPIYHGSYGLGGLREELDRVGSGAAAARLRNRHGAWPRVLALFRLLYEGSPHQAMPVPHYGGGLFEPGDSRSTDPVRRALAVFEDPQKAPFDAVVHTLLEKLTRTKVRIRQGRASRTVVVPVDFSDLSTEYIGILYEGLLDFELRRVADDDPVVFLALGDEPALPLSRLEQMDDKAIKGLVETFKKSSKLKVAGGDDECGEGAEEEESDAADDEGNDEDSASAATTGPLFGADAAAGDAEVAEPGEGLSEPTTDELDDAHAAARERAARWARRAIEAAQLVKRPRGRSAEAQRDFQQKLDALAQALTSRVVLPGEWFLVRFGGTRKGSGTFYTRPGLAVPTVHRTLQPLAYDPPNDAQGQPDEDAAPDRWTPKRPEQILGLKVCDPGCGSGSFLVASLRYLTEALLQALYHHGRIQEQGDRTLVTLAEGKPSEGRLSEETLPRRPDADDFDDLLRSRLKRYIVERCIYGVDLDPLAVELCRLALWVETLDRSLPFHFLDHKIKCGNSLVGCWFDRFADYPALAFEREGGDKSHNGVHFQKEAWTRAIKEFRNKRLKPDLVRMIKGQADLFEDFGGRSAAQVHDQALAVLEQMHALPVHETEERARLYREQVEGNEAVQKLKRAFDTWCALWFWPADALEHAPLPTRLAQPSAEVLEIVGSLQLQHRFFHWELEFADVFAAERAGFDAVVGNPPWEIQKPNSKEYFSNVDPLYRAYGKQEALGKQKELFANSPDVEREWLLYCAKFKGLSNFTKHAAAPFGDGASDGGSLNLGAGSAEAHRVWHVRRAGRRGYADVDHPFRLQGSADINTYKLFLEQALNLTHTGGQFGMIVPSGVYTDKGSTDLRTAFLQDNKWRWLFGFENREGIFDIHRSFKFCPVIVRKGGRTQAIRAAFMRRDVGDWAEGEKHVLEYPADRVERFSPRTRAILEIREKRDLEILEKIYANSVLLGDQSEDGWGIEYATEFHMTNDSKLLVPRSRLEGERLLSGTDDVRDLEVRARLFQAGYLPVWQGKNCAFDRWLSEPTLFSRVTDSDGFTGGAFPYGVRRIARNTDERTLVTCIVPRGVPTTYTIEICRTPSLGRALASFGFLSSFVLDYVARMQVDESVPLALLRGLPVPPYPTVVASGIADAVLSLLCPGMSVGERIAARARLDAACAVLFDLTPRDLDHILKDCGHPHEHLRNRQFTDKLDSAGFWRVDKGWEPQFRHSVLATIAFTELDGMLKNCGPDRHGCVRSFLRPEAGLPSPLPRAGQPRESNRYHSEQTRTVHVAGNIHAQISAEGATQGEIRGREAARFAHATDLFGDGGYVQATEDLEAERRGHRASAGHSAESRMRGGASAGVECSSTGHSQQGGS